MKKGMELRWNDTDSGERSVGGMILTVEERSTGRKTCRTVLVFPSQNSRGLISNEMRVSAVKDRRLTV